MKQHISVEQLNELSDKGKEKLRKWVLEKRYYSTLNPIRNKELPLLSIGQMIEFLDYRVKGWQYTNDPLGKYWTIWSSTDKKFESKELADALWEACKKVLK